MISKHKIIVVAFFIGHLVCGVNLLYSQSVSIADLVKAGAVFHDQGNYQEAIERYNEALKLDSTSTLANYEIAYTYYALREYEIAKKHCLIAMREYSSEYLNAALIYGSILDDLGNPDEAIKFYKKQLRTYPKSDLLHYNMGISYSKISRYRKAQEHFEAAIINNFSRASSHLALGELMYNKERRVESLLPLYFFLVNEL